MATDTKCDFCGEPAIGEVTVDLHASNVVKDGQPTSVRAAVFDVCDDSECRKELWRKIFDQNVAQIERDIPRHRVMVKQREVMDELESRMHPLKEDDDSLPELREQYANAQKLYNEAAREPK